LKKDFHSKGLDECMKIKKKGEWPDNYLLKKVTIMELFYVVASSSKRILSLVM